MLHCLFKENIMNYLPWTMKFSENVDRCIQAVLSVWLGSMSLQIHTWKAWLPRQPIFASYWIVTVTVN